MKKLFFLILFLLFSLISVAQTYTKKYNSINGRYEYFNSNGSMVGYEKYNSISNSWEYYTVTNNNNPYNRKPIEVAPVQSNVNLELIDRVMAKKQSNYDKNYNAVYQRINQINGYTKFFNTYSEYPQVKFFEEEIHNTRLKAIFIGVEAVQSDLSNNSLANQYLQQLDLVVNELASLYNKVKHYEQNPNYYLKN